MKHLGGLMTPAFPALRFDGGTGADGALNTGANVTLSAGNADSTILEMNYTTLTVNAGHTLTVAGRRAALIIRVQGDCTINGTITMAALGSNTSPSGDIVERAWKPSKGVYALGDMSVLKAAKAASLGMYDYRLIPVSGSGGGANRTGGYNYGNSAGDPGRAGVNGSTGGGGGGGSNSGNSFNADGGAGSAGNGWGGGCGGGGAAGQVTSGTGNSGGAASVGNGGGGGSGTGSNGGGGGAGPAPGAGGVGGTTTGANGGTGTGGILILIVGGNLTIGAAGVVSADGVAGGTANGSYAGCGGGSGGGSILIIYGGTLSNSGSVHANGGAGGNSFGNAGGSGGAGSVRLISAAAA